VFDILFHIIFCGLQNKGFVGERANQHAPPVEQFPKRKSGFKLHIGADLMIPGMKNLSRQASIAQKRASESDSDAKSGGLPLQSLAEYLGEKAMPALDAVREEQQRHIRDAKVSRRHIEPSVPYIPPMLPVTRWASKDAQFRATLVVDDDASRKARLSWYHPDDTMVPRDWFSRGLLEDMKYYNPFGWFSVDTKVGDGDVGDGPMPAVNE
jgi:hypothetical protein